MEDFSEANEASQVERLLKAADDASSKGDNNLALRLTTEALEIDGDHIEALHRRVSFYLNEFDFLSAETDAERIITLKPKDPRGHMARGLILQHISHHREALTFFLRALELGQQPAVDVVARVLQICVALGCAPDDRQDADFAGLDHYDQLVETGESLLRCRQHLLALEVLLTAATLAGGGDEAREARPPKIVMRVHLALGHAYSALKHYDEALASYGLCHELATAPPAAAAEAKAGGSGVSSVDVEHAAKSLVNMASIYSETGDTYRSLLHYEMLLDLRQRALASTSADDVFTDSFLASLYMNASLAYSAAGEVERALHYAEAHFAAAAADRDADQRQKSAAPQPDALARRRHLGSLYERSGEYTRAMSEYRECLRLAKTLAAAAAAGENAVAAAAAAAETGYAYGCLGGLYAALGAWPLALVMHERHVTIAERSGDRGARLAAYEMYGDALMRRGAHEAAADAYAQMARHCERNALAAATAWCKLGHSHYCLRHYQRAQHYFETALRVARDEHAQTRLDAQYGVACCLQTAADSSELERARRHFDELIAAVGAQVAAWRRERLGGGRSGSATAASRAPAPPRDLLARLGGCYDGAQLVLSKLGNDLDCLLYAERWRRLAARCHRALPPEATTPAGDDAGAGGGGVPVDPADVETLLATVRAQPSTVVYYSLLDGDDALLIWLLSPERGLLRFYARRPRDRSAKPLAQLIAELVGQLLDASSVAVADGAAAPSHARDRRDIADVNRPPMPPETRQPASQEGGERSHGEPEVGGDDLRSSADLARRQSQFELEKALYKLVLGPVDDLLQKLDVGSGLVVVPDKALSLCPFSSLRDLRGARLADRYRITCAPGLFAVDLARAAEARRRSEADELAARKRDARFGGVAHRLRSSAADDDGVEVTGDVQQQLLMPPGWRDAEAQRTTNPRHLTRYRTSVAAAAVTAAAAAAAGAAAAASASAPTATSAAASRSGGGVDAFLQQLPSDSRLLSRKRSAAERAFFSSLTDRDTESGNSDAHAPSWAGAPRSVSRTLRVSKQSTLVTKTSTGTDCVASSYAVPRFSQVSAPERAVVIGNPSMCNGSMLLRGKTWYVPETSEPCGRELRAVSEILQCEAVTHAGATKRRFLELLPLATVVHVATYMDLCDGLIAMAADDIDSPLLSRPVEERHYIISCDDIVRAGSRASLVVLSGGSAPSAGAQLDRQRAGSSGVLLLATAFLAAGAQSVLMFPISLPSEAMEQFFHCLYMQFANGCHVTDAIERALSALSSGNSANGEGPNATVSFPYLLVGGAGVYVDLLDIKSAMLDSAIDEVEKAAEQASSGPLLNLLSADAVLDPRDIAFEIQKVLKEVLELETSDCRIATELIILTDTWNEAQASPRRLSAEADRECVRRLLRLAGFAIEDVSLKANERRAMVLPPERDYDGLLQRLGNVAAAMRDLCRESSEAKGALYDVLPRDQTTLSHLVDVFAMTKHSHGVQLHVTDRTVMHLWTDAMCRNLLQQIGFTQIGTVVHFSRTPKNISLLDAGLRLALAFCLHKTADLIERLDARQLGPPPPPPERQVASSVAGCRTVKLPSLMPVLLATDKVSMRVPWLSCPEAPDEMLKKLELARKYSANRRHYDDQRRQLARLHGSLSTSLAAAALSDVGAERRPRPARVKVLPGSTASRDRVPLERDEPLAAPQRHAKRALSLSTLSDRLANASLRERHEVISALRPYCDAAEQLSPAAVLRPRPCRGGGGGGGGGDGDARAG